MIKYICRWGIITSSIVMLVACQDKPAQAIPPAPPPACAMTAELKQLVELTPLATSAINNQLELAGSVSFDQDRLYRYQSLVSGVIQKVYFKIGDFVQRGQVLAEVHTVELQSQKSELRKVTAELKLAQRQQAATQRLHEDGIASDKDLLEASNQVVLLQAEIDRLLATLQLQGANVEKDIMIIRAPLSGYVVEKKITGGYQVDAGEDDLFVLSDLKKVWVLANVYAAQLDLVKPGQEVSIRTTAYPEKVFKGKINRLSNVFDPEERIMKAIVEIDNLNLELKPSMMVSINIQQQSTRQAISIPASAVIFDNNTYYVLVYHNDCDVRAVNINPVANDSQYYYVDAPQVQANDTIVSKNQLLVYNKLRER